jgi:hypothetical protein
MRQSAARLDRQFEHGAFDFGVVDDWHGGTEMEGYL